MLTRLLIGLTAVVMALAVQPIFGIGHVAPAKPVMAAPIIFQTDMYGTNMVPQVQTSAWGFVRFFFNDAKTEADYTVDVKGLSGTIVTGADIRRAQRGQNGPVIHHLADGGFLTTSGHMRFSAADFNDITAGNWYVTLYSVDHPEGEMRGQVVLPDGFWTPTAVAPVAPPPVSVLPVVSPALPAAPSSPTLPPSALRPVASAPYSSCTGGAVTNVTFQWAPPAGSIVQWVDLSYYDEVFTPGTFYGYGPLYPFDTQLVWEGVPSGIPFVWRINSLTPSGWAASEVGLYTPGC